MGGGKGEELFQGKGAGRNNMVCVCLILTEIITS